MYAPILILVVSCLSAQEPVSLEQLARIALRENPRILAAQKNYEAAAQRPRTEEALPDPMVGVGYNSVGYPLPGAGLGTEPMANIGVMFSQEIPYPGKRGLRAQVASKQAQAAWESYRQAQLEVISNLSQAFYRLQHSQQMLEVVRRNREILDQMRLVAENRYSVGQGIQQDVIRSQVQLSILEAQRVQIQTMRQTAEAELNAVLNRPVGAPVGDTPEPRIMHPLPAFSEILDAALEGSPMVTREQRMIESSEASLTLARKEWYPDFAVNGGYYSMGAMGNLYMVRADIRLPLWGKKQRAGITEQANLLAGSRKTYEATQQALAARLQEEYLLAESARRLMDLYSTTVIPQANLALESSLASYRTGQADFMTALQNFMTAVEYEINYHEQMLTYHLALSRLEEMSAMPLTHAGGRP